MPALAIWLEIAIDRMDRGPSLSRARTHELLWSGGRLGFSLASIVWIVAAEPLRSTVLRPTSIWEEYGSFMSGHEKMFVVVQLAFHLQNALDVSLSDLKADLFERRLLGALLTFAWLLVLYTTGLVRLAVMAIAIQHVLDVLYHAHEMRQHLRGASVRAALRVRRMWLVLFGIAKHATITLVVRTLVAGGASGTGGVADLDFSSCASASVADGGGGGGAAAAAEETTGAVPLGAGTGGLTLLLNSVSARLAVCAFLVAFEGINAYLVLAHEFSDSDNASIVAYVARFFGLRAKASALASTGSISSSNGGDGSALLTESAASAGDGSGVSNGNSGASGTSASRRSSNADNGGGGGGGGRKKKRK